MDSRHHIGVYESKSGYNAGKQYCSLTIANQHLVNALYDNGVVFNKTLTLQYPDNNIIPESLERHFIRGYFDGDGSVYLSTVDKTGVVSFTGSEQMLEGILERFQKAFGTNTH